MFARFSGHGNSIHNIVPLLKRKKKKNKLPEWYLKTDSLWIVTAQNFSWRKFLWRTVFHPVRAETLKEKNHKGHCRPGGHEKGILVYITTEKSTQTHVKWYIARIDKEL